MIINHRIKIPHDKFISKPVGKLVEELIEREPLSKGEFYAFHKNKQNNKGNKQ